MIKVFNFKAMLYHFDLNLLYNLKQRKIITIEFGKIYFVFLTYIFIFYKKLVILISE